MHAFLDENLNNTWDWTLLADAMSFVDGRLMPTKHAVADGPGAFVTTADPEPAWNAWYMAPGWNVDDRAQDAGYTLHPAELLVNPWDHVFGIVGDYGRNPVAARVLANQQGRISM